jgi:hypothetical protein
MAFGSIDFPGLLRAYTAEAASEAGGTGGHALQKGTESFFGFKRQKKRALASP